MEAPATPLGFSVGFATELARRPSLPSAAQPNSQWAPGIWGWADDQKPRIENCLEEAAAWGGRGRADGMEGEDQKREVFR